MRGHREAVQGAGRWASAVRIAGEAPFTLLPPVQGEAGRGAGRAPAVRCGSSRARPRRSPEPRDSRSGSPCIPAVRAKPFAPRPLPAVRHVARHRPPRPDADGGRRSRRCIHRWEIDAGSGSHPAVAREAASTIDARPTSARCATAWRARVFMGTPLPASPLTGGRSLSGGASLLSRGEEFSGVFPLSRGEECKRSAGFRCAVSASRRRGSRRRDGSALREGAFRRSVPRSSFEFRPGHARLAHDQQQRVNAQFSMIRNRNGRRTVFPDLLHPYVTTASPPHDETVGREDSANLTAGKNT